MPLLNYTTSIAPTKTVMEIQSALAKSGASAIMANYDTNGNIVALSFQLMTENGTMAFKLPTAWEPVQKVLIKQRVSPKYQTPEHALRVAWRITKDWVEAQLAIIETQMVTTAQVFLPYAVMNDGGTVFEYFASNQGLLLSDGSEQHN